MKTAFAVFLCLVAFALAAAPVAEDELASDRAQFERAYSALTKGQRTSAKRLVKGLENYPLYVYYRYFELNRRLHKASKKDVREFLAAYDDSFLTNRLRRDWLKHLSRSKQWDSFLHDYRPQSNTKLKCAQLTARIKTGASEGVLSDSRALWLVGKSQPTECDTAFEHLKANKQIDDRLIWQRIRLALGNNEPGLARYLSRQLKAKDLKLAAKNWLAAHSDPKAVLKRKFFTEDDAQVREIVVHAISRLARVNIGQAAVLWADFSARLSFTDHEVGQVLRSIALAAASDDHPRRIELLDQVPDGHVDDRMEKYRVREAIRLDAWEQLIRWTDRHPVGDTDILRWRYWRARALQMVDRKSDADAIFKELAKHRDYYGFLSADQLGLDYRMNDRPILPSELELAEISTRPGIIRARELYRLGMRFKARREWAYEIEQLTPEQLEIAAYLVHRWGWHDRAIFALGKARSYDDLAIRFPLLHEKAVREYAEKRGLAPATIYSIIRTESAFMIDARSGAGALGLMQLMPATGRQTARRVGTRLRNTRELLDPEKNISIGSAYLKQMLDRFDGSFSLATAAYNAGPHRARKWRPESGCVPADVWIDTIPFRETRRYVRRASFYATVYQWRLDEELEPLARRLTDVTPNGTKQQC